MDTFHRLAHLIRPLPTVRRDLAIWRMPVIAEFANGLEARDYMDRKRAQGEIVELWRELRARRRWARFVRRNHIVMIKPDPRCVVRNSRELL
jgi:hypothetical protein